MTRILLLAAITAIGFPINPIRAEKANMTPEKLAKTATHIVDGEVTAIYTRATKDGDWATTHYVAEVRVAESEKGEGIEQGSLIYIRYWDRNWISDRPVEPSTNGHRGLPGEGDFIHVYLSQAGYDGFGHNNDGGFNVIGANGFEILKPADGE